MSKPFNRLSSEELVALLRSVDYNVSERVLKVLTDLDLSGRAAARSTFVAHTFSKDVMQSASVLQSHLDTLEDCLARLRGGAAGGVAAATASSGSMSFDKFAITLDFSSSAGSGGDKWVKREERQHREERRIGTMGEFTVDIERERDDALPPGPLGAPERVQIIMNRARLTGKSFAEFPNHMQVEGQRKAAAMIPLPIEQRRVKDEAVEIGVFRHRHEHEVTIGPVRVNIVCLYAEHDGECYWLELVVPRSMDSERAALLETFMAVARSAEWTSASVSSGAGGGATAGSASANNTITLREFNGITVPRLGTGGNEWILAEEKVTDAADRAPTEGEVTATFEPRRMQGTRDQVMPGQVPHFILNRSSQLDGLDFEQLCDRAVQLCRQQLGMFAAMVGAMGVEATLQVEEDADLGQFRRRAVVNINVGPIDMTVDTLYALQGGNFYWLELVVTPELLRLDPRIQQDYREFARGVNFASAAAADGASSSSVAATAAAAQDDTVLEMCGLVFDQPGSAARRDRWRVRDENATEPFVVMGRLEHERFAGAPDNLPGLVPSIVVGLNSINHYANDFDEYRQIMKNDTLRQLLPLGGGMVQPRVVRDEACDYGPFSHLLEIRMHAGPLNLMILLLFGHRAEDCLVPSLQLMVSPAHPQLGDFQEALFTLARSARFRGQPNARFDTDCYVSIIAPPPSSSSPAAQVSVRLPATGFVVLDPASSDSARAKAALPFLEQNFASSVPLFIETPHINREKTETMCFWVATATGDQAEEPWSVQRANAGAGFELVAGAPTRFFGGDDGDESEGAIHMYTFTEGGPEPSASSTARAVKIFVNARPGAPRAYLATLPQPQASTCLRDALLAAILDTVSSPSYACRPPASATAGGGAAATACDDDGKMSFDKFAITLDFSSSAGSGGDKWVKREERQHMAHARMGTMGEFTVDIERERDDALPPGPLGAPERVQIIMNRARLAGKSFAEFPNHMQVEGQRKAEHMIPLEIEQRRVKDEAVEIGVFRHRHEHELTIGPVRVYIVCLYAERDGECYWLELAVPRSMDSERAALLEKFMAVARSAEWTSASVSSGAAAAGGGASASATTTTAGPRRHRPCDVKHSVSAASPPRPRFVHLGSMVAFDVNFGAKVACSEVALPIVVYLPNGEPRRPEEFEGDAAALRAEMETKPTIHVAFEMPTAAPGCSARRTVDALYADLQQTAAQTNSTLRRLKLKDRDDRELEWCALDSTAPPEQMAQLRAQGVPPDVTLGTKCFCTVLPGWNWNVVFRMEAPTSALPQLTTGIVALLRSISTWE